MWKYHYIHTQRNTLNYMNCFQKPVTNIVMKEVSLCNGLIRPDWNGDEDYVSFRV